MSGDVFARHYLSEPLPPDPLYDLAFAAWLTYYETCEAYDRSVCTGPIFHGGILPATRRERALINQNAQRFDAEVKRHLAANGVDNETSKRARRAALMETEIRERRERP
jgi:hypothetical protein